jgi:hypothetical protein
MLGSFSGIASRLRACGSQPKWEWLVAHLVRDEGVAGSNPATPTTFPEPPIAYAASYAERIEDAEPLVLEIAASLDRTLQNADEKHGA